MSAQLKLRNRSWAPGILFLSEEDPSLEAASFGGHGSDIHPGQPAAQKVFTVVIDLRTLGTHPDDGLQRRSSRSPVSGSRFHGLRGPAFERTILGSDGSGRIWRR